MVALKDVATLVSGGTPSRTNADYFGEGLPWVAIGDLTDGVVTETGESLTDAGLANSAAKTAPAGTVLLAMYGASIGKLGVAGMSLCTNQAIAAIQPKRGAVDNRYIFHFLLAQRQHLRARGRGGAQPNISLGDLKEWLVPLPSLDEQRRIADILDKANTMRIARREVVAHLKQLNRSLFRSMFSQTMAPTRTVLLGDLITDAQLGLVRGSKDIGPDRSHPYVRMDAITPTGEFLPRDADRTEASDADVRKHAAREGDLLFNTRNTRELVGKSAIFRGAPRLINNNILRLRFHEDVALAAYIHGFLWSPAGLQELSRRKSGTTSVFAIYGKHLATIPIPLPPIDTQVAYAEALNAICDRTSLATAQETEFNQLFTSLQSRAFRGEL